MNTPEKALLLEMMAEHGNCLGDAGCSDWCWPSRWSYETRLRFLRGFNLWVEQGEEYPAVEYHPKYGPPDFAVWDYLTHLMKDALR